MAPLNLSRIKLEDSFSFRGFHAKANLVKKENTSTPMKVEPKNEYIFGPIQSEFMSSFPDTKSVKLFTNICDAEMGIKTRKKCRKRYSFSSLSPMSRRPKLPIAQRVYKYLTTKDPNTLTKRELDSLAWAESVLVSTILKRKEDYTSKETLVKVLNPFAKSFSKAESKIDISIPNALQLEVVDFGSPDQRYNIERGKIIERAFNKAVVDHILSKSVPTTPRYGLSTWRNGVLVLDCKDTNSYRFAQDTVRNIIPWRKALLRAIPPNPDNIIYIAKFHAPDIDIQKEDVIPILKSQNPNINMQSWRLIEERATLPGFKTYYLAITRPPVKFLENKYLKLLFGATELGLELIKSEIDC